MKIVPSSKQKQQDTGIIAEVYPFSDREDFSFSVRKNNVSVIGCAEMPPIMVRLFARALVMAANIAESGIYGQEKEEKTIA